jgi:hypothetical protein
MSTRELSRHRIPDIFDVERLLPLLSAGQMNTVTGTLTLAFVVVLPLDRFTFLALWPRH